MLPLLLLVACGDQEAQERDLNIGDTADNVEHSDTAEESNEANADTVTWTNDTINDLVNQDGCSDYFVYLSNEEDTLSLHISGSGLALEAHQHERGVVEYTYEIDPMTDEIQPRIVALKGGFLNAWSCNDASINEPRVDAEYPAISGTMHVVVVAEGELTDWGEAPANISIELTNICFDAENAFCIDSYVLTQYIGWLPG